MSSLVSPSTLQKGLYSESGSPRLQFARTYFFEYSPGIVDLDELQEFWLEWMEHEERLVLQRQEWIPEKGMKKDTIAVKASKRGNDVYFNRTRKRLQKLEGMDCTFFDPHENIKRTKAVLVTLTYDTKINSIRDAWETIGSDYNRYITGIREQYGHVSVVRVWEAFFNGYPHVHALMYFHDYDFRVFRHYSSQHQKHVWRVAEKAEFENWHSNVDVIALRSFHSGMRYVVKYMTKGYAEAEITPAEASSESGLRKNLSDLTLSLCWLFRKHSFSFSGQGFHDLKELLRNSKRKIFQQLNLMGNPVKKHVTWVFLGIKSLVSLKSEYPKLDFSSWVVALTHARGDPLARDISDMHTLEACLP